MKTEVSGTSGDYLFACRVLYFSGDTAGKDCHMQRLGKLGAGAFAMVACAVEWKG